MFAPILAANIEKLNSLIGSNLNVLAVPNTYFGGDVAVGAEVAERGLVSAAVRAGGDSVLRRCSAGFRGHSEVLAAVSVGARGA